MSSPIQYYVKNSYGNDRNYVADPVIAKAISTLTGDLTISWRHISALEALGHKFEQVLPPGSRRNYGSVPLVTVRSVADMARDICTPDSRTL